VGRGILSLVMMQLNVLYFAHVRERVGKRQETLALEDGADVAAAVAAIVGLYPDLGPLMPAIRVALDGEFTSLDAPLHDGAELVLIPPVAGGAGTPPATGGAGVPAVTLTEEALDAARQEALGARVAGPGHGAVVTFVGAVRDHARGRAVERLEYEAYGAMAQRQLEGIVAEVEATWPGVAVAVHHRVGTLTVGEVAVVVAVGSAHRAEAFAACQRVIDRLKEDVPIWKREIGPDGAEWVSDRP